MKNEVNAILEGLNDEQRAAVSCVEGPVLIVAGAGSGKTRVLTSRIAYLLAKGVEASSILALTFTKKAAGEMKDRIASMVGTVESRNLVMGTFHSVFIRFLRDYHEFLGYPEKFTIYDSSDQQSAMRACIKELGLDDKTYKPKEVLSRISLAKNNLITANGYRNKSELINQDMVARKGKICELYSLYQSKLMQAGVMDFDDILLNMNILLRDNNEALREISSRFRYIMVDEYQDTNFSQYLIIKKLSGKDRNICVVGDDSQSIYAFRGAKIENILNFQKDYPEMKVFRLERNYRSTQVIVDAANSLIEHNTGRIPKKCYAVGPQGSKISLRKAYGEKNEATIVVSEILSKMRSEHTQYQDFAILYRTNEQSRVLEEQLRLRNIPYMIYSGNSFFDRMEIKDMMAYFKLCVNNGDDESFKRIVNKPTRGIGATTLSAVLDFARANNCTLFQAARSFEKLKPFCEMILRLSALVPATDAAVLAQKIADESGLYALFKNDTSIEGQSRAANVEELMSSVASFVNEREEEAQRFEYEEGMEVRTHIFTLDDYLENTALLSNVDVSDDEDSANKVALMTVHSAKGLEFPYVFVTGMEENLFPSRSLSGGVTSADIEEERRLFYVAMTRAQKALYVLYSETRMRNGKTESNPVSRFVKEVDSQYFDRPLKEEDKSESVGINRFGSGFGRSAGFGSSRGAAGYRYGAAYGSDSGYSTGDSSVIARRMKSDEAISANYGIATQARNDRKSTRNDSFGIRNDNGPRQLPRKDFQASPMSELRAGQRIEHSHFGLGTIISLTGRAPEMKAQIHFDDFGDKLLLLQYAKIRIV